MFTPHRRPSTAVSLTPRSQARSSSGKGKAVAVVNEGHIFSPPPPVASLGGSEPEELEAEGMGDWRRFKEAGLLDEAVLERKDREALSEKAACLEKELREYQYNMGLLIMGKNEWSSKYEELREALAETQEILKREKSAHVIALCNVEEREENLRRALKVEKQSAMELEKALCDLQEEHVQIKHASEKRLCDVRNLVAGIEEKSLDVKEKMCAAESRLSEVSTKSSELGMKLHEIESRERVLERERLSLKTEQQAHEKLFIKQRQDLHEWEGNLQRREERLSELRRSLDVREETTNENDEILNQKEGDLREAEKKIDLLFAKLKEREHELGNRLADLIAKEKDVDCLQNILGRKDKEMFAFEEKLHKRQQTGVQDLLSERRDVLDDKMREFEMELYEKRKNLDDGIRSKVDSLEQQEAQILHKEEKLRRQEQALDKKSERVKEKEQDLDARLRNVNERDAYVKTEQERLELKRLQFLADKEILKSLESECEKIRGEISQQGLQISAERESLLSMNDERSEYLHLQSEVKQELERCRQQQEFVLREAEDLKDERKKFENEWEVIEAKRAQITHDLKVIVEEREQLKQMQENGEDRLKEEKHVVEENFERELEALRIEKESLEARMRYENTELSERAKKEHDQMVQEFESQRRNLESTMIHWHEEMEKHLQEMERELEVKQERELSQIRYLKESTQREIEEIRSEKSAAIEKKRQEILEDVEKLKEQQLNMQKDITELDLLRKKLQEQRQQVVNERNHFLSFVEKLKCCNTCEDIPREFILSDLCPPEVEDMKNLPLPKLLDASLKDNQQVADTHASINAKRFHDEQDLGFSGSKKSMSWFRRCTSKIFSTSPKNMVELDPVTTLPERLSSSSLQVKLDKEDERSGLPVSEEAKENIVPIDELGSTHVTVNDSFDIQQLQSDGVSSLRGEYSVSLGEHSYMDSGVQTRDDSVQSELQGLHKHSTGGKNRLSKTQSMKRMVKDAKLFLGQSLDERDQNESFQTIDGDYVVIEGRDVEKATSKAAKKRGRSHTENEQDAGDSEGGSINVGDNDSRRTKRRQTVSSNVLTPRQKRYNFRRHANSRANADAPVPSETVKAVEKVAGHGAANGQAPNGETTSMLTHNVIGKANVAKDSVHVSTSKVVEFLHDEYKAEGVDKPGASKPVEITELIEEVSGSSGNGVEEHPDTNEDDHDDEDLECPREVSIGKRILTSFTT